MTFFSYSPVYLESTSIILANWKVNGHILISSFEQEMDNYRIREK